MRRDGAESIYEIADQFRRRCLASDRSLLWPDRPAWTASNVREWKDAFIAAPDPSKRPFLQKWSDQMGPRSPFPTAAGTFEWRGISKVLRHYYRINTRLASGEWGALSGWFVSLYCDRSRTGPVF